MTARLRVLFAGTPKNAAETLAGLHTAGIEIVGVITRNDSIVGRSKQLKASPVAEKAEELGIAVLKTNSVDAVALEWSKALRADVGAVVAYGSIFRKEMLEIPRLGWFNLHYSLLPELPGPAPVQNALLLGKKVTGVTLFRLDEGIDTGPIVSQEQAIVDELDDAGSLLSKLTPVGCKMLIAVLTAGEPAIIDARAQQRGVHQTHASKPTRELARLNFRESAESQFNKVRAMNPEPIAWFEHKGSPVRVLRARTSAEHATQMSEARVVGKDLIVGCGQDSLVLEIIQPAGKQRMSGADWFRGLRVEKLMIS